MTRTHLSNTISSACRWAALLTLALSPTQWSLIQSPRIGIADLMLVAALALMGVDTLLRRNWQHLWRTAPHWTSLALIAAVALSATTAVSRSEAIKELLQLIEYFILALWLFSYQLHNTTPLPSTSPSTSTRPFYLVMGVATSLILLLATLQYFALDGHPSARVFIEPKILDIIANRLGGLESPLLVCGTFGSRNILGGYLTLATPIAMAALLNRTLHWGLRLACTALVLAALTLTLSGPSYWTIVIALLSLAALRGWRWFIPVAATLILWQATVLPKLPRENDLCHFTSAALYEGDGTPARRYPEWQAATNMLLENPWSGCGPGSYQQEIGPYYGTIPNATGPAEPDIQNLYMVTAASCGLPTLLTLIALFVTAFATALHRNRHGVAFAIAAFATTAIWHPLLVRGIGIPLAFVLALAYLPAAPNTGTPPDHPTKS